jgi:hypothetical protein
MYFLGGVRRNRPKNMGVDDLKQLPLRVALQCPDHSICGVIIKEVKQNNAGKANCSILLVRKSMDVVAEMVAQAECLIQDLLDDEELSED